MHFFFSFLLSSNNEKYAQKKGYSTHPNYGMVIPPDYSSNSYSGYGSAAVAAAAAAAAAAYQCGAANSTSGSVIPYTNSIMGPGVGYQNIPVSGGSINTGSCYSMPPPQHLSQHDKNSAKDR